MIDSNALLIIISIQLSGAISRSPFSRSFKKTGKKCRILANQSGQGTLEYILLLIIVIAGAATFTGRLVSKVDDQLLTVGGQLERQLKTGRANVNTWRN
ncbi:MAG: hypothetical protein EOP09_02090 [Proteobacteria bacterium]|nr:MAG: hypothetical protein EOP09_02090 [Pseudomonadota bacterium]